MKIQIIYLFILFICFLEKGIAKDSPEHITLYIYADTTV